MISSKKISLISLLVSCLALHAHAHAAIAPALGVEGNPVRADVQRPSTAEPCGSIPISDINTSTAVPLSSDGSADFTVTNFNGQVTNYLIIRSLFTVIHYSGTDGSREVTAEVDPTGTGKSFEAATVTTNGDGDPSNVGSQPLVVQLPAGIKCTGGTAGNLCLMSFKTTSGFGNCAVVSQGAAAKAASTATGGAKAAVAASAAAKTSANAAANKNTDATANKEAGAAKSEPAAATAAVAKPTAEAKADADKANDKKEKKGKGKGKDKGKGKGKGKGKDEAKGKGKGQAATAKTANQPAGARAVRSYLASGADAIAKRGSWIWA